ncbi:hypothetical protein [Flaviflexus huanghaiensis]|uniref:hypothetical protein n=1 Tax=Flaviflexus huanghaiensis TaxID=1111473 RepID=UPI0015FB2436|nr:hypothetical protein [Flaviflexus huanghaiensis]
MEIDPRTALDRLIGALEAFHDTAALTRDPEADSVLEATDHLADAYTIYDDAVFTSFGVELPLDVYGDDDDDDDDDDDIVYVDDDDDDSDDDSDDGDDSDDDGDDIEYLDD